MTRIDIAATAGSLTAQIESAVRDVLGPLPLQTDFRRDVAAAADATVLVKAPLDPRQGAALAAAFAEAGMVDAARLARQKLTLRFTDAFVAELSAARLSAAPGGRPATGRSVVIDFCDPNANKALHVGHLRNVALGGALAGLWRRMGATVTCQSVVCDIGRNVAEALAGLLAAGAEAALADPQPLAPRLGQLYARYVRDAAVSVDGHAQADAPIERELSRHDDDADRLLDRWRAGDPDIHGLWRQTIDRVLAEQAATLAGLGVGFERILRESDAIAAAPALAGALVAAGLGSVDAGGAHVLHTGRPDYPRCPLTRSDGFPTEHLRALVLWDGLRDALSGVERIVHVMGHEWRTSTDIRIEALEALRRTDFPDRYRPLPHRMVRLGGSDMKSSRGDVILIDDLGSAVEAVLAAQAWYGDPGQRLAMQRAAVLAPMLEAEPEATLDVTLSTFLDPVANPGLRIARVLGATRAAADDGAVSPAKRFLVLQMERMERMVEQATERGEPQRVLRHLLRLVDDRLSGALSTDGDGLLRDIVLDTLAALGWHAGGRAG